MINTIGSWDYRPNAYTRIPNLFLAADYVRNTVNLATMEGANEATRGAVNALLARAGSSAAPAKVFPLYQEPLLKQWREQDEARYRLGLPNQFDLIKPYWPSR